MLILLELLSDEVCTVQLKKGHSKRDLLYSLLYRDWAGYFVRNLGNPRECSCNLKRGHLRVKRVLIRLEKKKKEENKKTFCSSQKFNKERQLLNLKYSFKKEKSFKKQYFKNSAPTLKKTIVEKLKNSGNKEEEVANDKQILSFSKATDLSKIMLYRS